MDKACIVGFVLLFVLENNEDGDDDDDDDDDVTICAFCFRTSAGVRMKHETHSAAEEASPLMTGVGRVNGRGFLTIEPSPSFVASECRMCLTPSYVVKKAPAEIENQSLSASSKSDHSFFGGERGEDVIIGTYRRVLSL